MPVSAIAKQVGVSERTVSRHLAALSPWSTPLPDGKVIPDRVP
jgi:hypothetical protein